MHFGGRSELSKKLETEVTLNFTELQPMISLASFKKLVESGMDANKAAGVSGLMALENE